MIAKAECGHKISLIAEIFNLKLTKRRIGIIRWKGHCPKCKHTYFFTAEGTLMKRKDK